MCFNVSIANLTWGIISLLFAVKGQKTAKVRLFLHRLDLQKAGVSSAESSSLAVVLLQITAKTATAPKVSQRAPPQSIAVNLIDLFRRVLWGGPPALHDRLHLPRASRRGDLPVHGWHAVASL